MQLQPIVYTTNLPAAVAWYSTVLEADPVYSSDMWTAFAVGSATLGIHQVGELPPEGRSVVSLIAQEALEDIVERLETAGITIDRPIQDEAFGRSFVVRDPDGSPIQVNEHRR